MPSIRARKDGRLFFDFYYRGARCRELSSLADTPANRRKMQRALAVIDGEIAAGTFDYGRTFPGSKKAASLGRVKAMAPAPALAVDATADTADVPTLAEFAQVWKLEKQVEWRVSYRDAVDSILAAHLLPEFGEVTSRADRESAWKNTRPRRAVE